MTAMDLENPHAGQGMVMLDIGGDVGALVVTMPASMVGEEVEIRPVGAASDDHDHDHGDLDHQSGHGHSHHPHVAVHERPIQGGVPVPSLVFPELTTDRYELYVKGTTNVVLTVDVRGGEVSTAIWPE